MIIGSMPSFQPPPRAYKGVYPFRLATTSFIYPANWCTNAELLGPYVDEIELLFLESRYEGCFPSTGEIDGLLALSKKHALTYNVHLPADISLGDSSAMTRSETVDILCKVVDFAEILTPSTWTLHLPGCTGDGSATKIADWRAWCRDGLEQFIGRSGLSPEALSIETLFYPFEWIGDIIKDLGVSVCIDTGHLMLTGRDPLQLYGTYAEKVSIIHLHGVHGKKDHVSLDQLTSEQAEPIVSLLGRFQGTVSIEVFSADCLTTSLAWLDHQWRRRPLNGRIT